MKQTPLTQLTAMQYDFVLPVFIISMASKVAEADYIGSFNLFENRGSIQFFDSEMKHF